MRWITVKKTDPKIVAMHRRHYSANLNADHAKHGVCGPGESLCMMTDDGSAAIVFRYVRYAHAHSDMNGIHVAMFRNEGDQLSSDLILTAEAIAWDKWTHENRIMTFVDATAVRSTNPGYCFKCAGWVPVGRTKRRDNVILVKRRGMP